MNYAWYGTFKRRSGYFLVELVASSQLTSCNKQSSILSRLVVNLILKWLKLFCHCWNSCVLSVHVCFGEPTALIRRLQRGNSLCGFLPVSSHFLYCLRSVFVTFGTCAFCCTVSVFGKSLFYEMWFFICLSSRVKLICPELVTDLCLERSGVLLRGASAPRFYETQACYFKACLCKYNFMKQFASREQNNWGIIKLLKTEKCLICARRAHPHSCLC